MYRRRHDDENTSSVLPVVEAVDENDGDGRSDDRKSKIFLPLLCCRRQWNNFNALSISKRIILTLLVTWAGYFIVQKLIRAYSWIIPRNVEEPFKDHPYWRALVFNPIRYFQAKYYLESRPRKLRNFTMTPERAYYINMDRSKDRMKAFMEMNKDQDDEGQGGETNIQRFSAHEWVAAGDGNNNNNKAGRDSAARQSLQKKWEDRYPFLRISSRKKKYGDAGCSLSHILLWQEKLIDNNDAGDGSNPYLFVFEDDALLLDPLRRQRRRKNENNASNNYPIISAPDKADIVFLVGTAMKLVDVPWRGSHEELEPAVRVIGGFGALGYIITREGAIKMMEYLRSSKEPVDLSFFQAPTSLKVFLPISSQWPAVRHKPTGGSRSARINLNQRRGR